VQCLVSLSKVLALVDHENTVQIMEVIELSKEEKDFAKWIYVYEEGD